jgi:hypothetical protein
VRPAPPETVQFMTTARIRDSVAAPAYP